MVTSGSSAARRRPQRLNAPGAELPGMHPPDEWSALSAPEQRALSAVVEAASTVAPDGTLRLVLQTVALLRHGTPAGDHRLLDAVVDVDGNMVVIEILPQLLARPETADSLGPAIERFEAELDHGHGRDRSGYAVSIDADGRRAVHVRRDGPLEIDDAGDPAAHPAILGGDHQIMHHAPELEDLRDRVARSPGGRLRRWWRGMRRRFRRDHGDDGDDGY